MVISQFFAIMPVMNVMTRDVSKLKFKWMSLRTLYCCVCSLGVAGYAGLTVAWVLAAGVEFSRCVTIIFYSSNCIAMCIFLRLSMKWPKIMVRWQATESLMSPLLRDRSQRYLSAKIKLLAAIILSLSLSKSTKGSIIQELISFGFLPFQLSTSCRMRAIFTLPISVPMSQIRSRPCLSSSSIKCLSSPGTTCGKP